MQKKVLAAVIGGLLATPAAFADSANVTISGRFAFGIEQYKVSGGSAAGYNTEQRVSDQSSSLIFSGSEDLGGGLKAVFQIDNRFNEVGTFGATGNTFVGFAGDFGRVVVGRHDLHYNEIGAFDYSRSGSLQNWLSAGPFSQVSSAAGAGLKALGYQTIAVGSRTPNVILWDSPNMSGLTARVAYSTRWAPTSATSGVQEGTGVGATDSGKDGAITAALRWTSGPLTVGASYWDANREGEQATTNDEAGDQQSIRGWVGYVLPFGLSVAVAYDSSELRMANGESMTKRNAILIPIKYTMGAETFYVRFVDLGKLSGPNAGATTDQTDATAFALGWDHAFSKRTSAGIYYTSVDNKANAAYDMFALGASGGTTTSAGEDSKQIYFGVTHTY